MDIKVFPLQEHFEGSTKVVTPVELAEKYDRCVGIFSIINVNCFILYELMKTSEFRFVQTILIA